MDAANSLRISQPSGGNDKTKFNAPHGSGSDPSMVRGLSPEDLPLQMDYKKLGTNIMLFGVGFVGGYFLYTGLFNQTVTLPITMPPKLRWGGAQAPAPTLPVVNGNGNGNGDVVPPPPPPPTPMDIAQQNPQAVANALLYMQA